MKRCLSFVLVHTMAVYSMGCSLAAPGTQSIAIVPSHPKADVYVDGVQVGTGTVTAVLSRDNSHTAMAKCPGSSGIFTIQRGLSTTGMLDIVGGVLLLVPLIGLFSAGAFELSPATVAVAIPDESGCDASPPSAGG